MELGAVRDGDIVQVEKKGRRFHAFVTVKRSGRLEVLPIEPGISYRHVTAREVTEHYRRRRRRGGAARAIR